MSKYRLAIVNDTLKGGGAERVVLQLATFLSASDYSVDLVLCNFEGELLEEIPPKVKLFALSTEQKSPPREWSCSIQPDKIGWFNEPEKLRLNDYFQVILPNWPLGLKVLPRPRNRYVLFSRLLSRYFTERQPDIVFAILPNSFCCASIGLKLSRLNIPIIGSLHAMLEPNSEYAFRRRTYDICKKMLSTADAVHTVSLGCKSDLVRYQICPANQPIFTIYNPVVRPEVEIMGKKPALHEWVDNKHEYGHRIILSVGRLAKGKNHKLLVNAFAKISEKINSKLIILGEGSERTNLAGLISELNLHHKVSLPGWVKNPFSFMRRCDVFVMSSDFESLSNVIVEALQCGCRIVSTDCPHGPRELLDGGKYGTLVPMNDEFALANAIQMTLESDSDRASLRKRASELAWETIGPQYEQLFDDVYRSFER